MLQILPRGTWKMDIAMNFENLLSSCRTHMSSYPAAVGPVKERLEEAGRESSSRQQQGETRQGRIRLQDPRCRPCSAFCRKTRGCASQDRRPQVVWKRKNCHLQSTLCVPEKAVFPPRILKRKHNNRHLFEINARLFDNPYLCKSLPTNSAVVLLWSRPWKIFCNLTESKNFIFKLFRKLNSSFWWRIIFSNFLATIPHHHFTSRPWPFPFPLCKKQASSCEDISRFSSTKFV